MNLFRDLIELFFPRVCCICEKPLVGSEHEICTDCLLNLPESVSAIGENNFVEKRLWGRVKLESATALLIFKQKSNTQKILHEIKYKGNEKLAVTMGRQLGLHLAQSGRFDDIDCLVPVPLFRRKERQRGYNQSLLLCQGIAETFPRPTVTDALIRTRHTDTQTHKNRIERLDNMKGVFAVTDAESLKNKHVLLIDDVITTGATTEACCIALQSVEGIRISVAALAVANDC